jgi:hypothetical protein
MPIFARLKSPTIAHRLIVSIVLFSSCFTFLFTGLQLYAGYRFDLRQIDDNFDLIEQGYLDVIANSLWAFDQKQLELVLQTSWAIGALASISPSASRLNAGLV